MNWLDVLTLVIAGLTFLVTLSTLLINLRDRKEHCRILFNKGFGTFNTIDSYGSQVETQVPGFEIAIINPGRQPLYVESVHLCADEWQDPIQILFRAKMQFTGHSFVGGDTFIIEPRRKVRSSVSIIDILEKTQQQGLPLAELKVWVEVTLEPGGIYHTNPVVISRAQLVQAQEHKFQLTTR